MAGGSKPRPWVMSCPDTASITGMGREEDHPGGPPTQPPAPTGHLPEPGLYGGPGARPPAGIMLFIHLASAGWLKRRKVDWPRHNIQPTEKANAEKGREG